MHRRCRLSRQNSIRMCAGMRRDAVGWVKRSADPTRCNSGGECLYACVGSSLLLDSTYRFAATMRTSSGICISPPSRRTPTPRSSPHTCAGPAYRSEARGLQTPCRRSVRNQRAPSPGSCAQHRRDLQEQVYDGNMLCELRPSGSETQTLRCLAGLSGTSRSFQGRAASPEATPGIPSPGRLTGRGLG